MVEKNGLSLEIPKELDDAMGIIQLVTGEVDYRSCWAYVSMYPSTYMEYLDKVEAHETMNIEDYGIVIETGWGQQPPQDVQDRMKRDFGADPNMAMELAKIVQQLEDEAEDNEQDTMN